MTDHGGKRLPQPTRETQPFWDGCRDRKLLIQHCADCGHYQFYPRIVCGSCMSDRVEWVQATGRGTVASFTIVRRPVSEAYAAEVPYVVALIQLEEGPTMMSNVIQCDPERVAIGMPVEVIFEDWSDEITVPKFRP